ncbi:hypothetical protein [Roseivivax sp. THAF197b]|uniref:hypothetical protein n=1 Tax=Roseivivax sp. THAF197b TaxID=2588299 RepID=UPI0012685A61|nr:hypothetical protein [Roseivivax sp. THAF197b]QFS84836.1 hypothetical protein FIV09_18495 [Roseivivax sp. THAF197b]
MKIDVLMSGPSLNKHKLSKLEAETVAISNTFDACALKTKKLKSVYYFISDPDMFQNLQKVGIIEKNISILKKEIILVIPRRFLLKRKFFRVFLKLAIHKGRLSLYKADDKSYKSLSYTFSKTSFPNLQTVLLDAAIPTLIHKGYKDITVYGTDLNYGNSDKKSYGLTSQSLQEKNEIKDQSEWREFVISGIIFYISLAKRHYGAKIYFDRDSGAGRILTKMGVQ